MLMKRNIIQFSEIYSSEIEIFAFQNCKVTGLLGILFVKEYVLGNFNYFIWGDKL